MAEVRVRIDGTLEGVHGPMFPVPATRKMIAGLMGWRDSGEAEGVITRTLDLLREGKAVRLTSRHGRCTVQPLLDSEDGRVIPASASTVYNPDGAAVERLVAVNGDALAARVKSARAAARMSQSELADRSGVPLKTLLAIEQGVTLDPKTSTTTALAKALGVTVEELAGGE